MKILHIKFETSNTVIIKNLKIIGGFLINMKIFGIFFKNLSKKSLFKIPSFNFSSKLFEKLLQLKESPHEKINGLINETLPILLQKPAHINELIQFYQEFEKNNTISIGFPIYLNLYSNFFQKYPKTINISSLDIQKITSLVDLLIQFPDLLINNKGFFNSLDLYFIKNKDFTSALESCKVQEIFFRIPYISPTLTPSLTSLGNIEAR